MDRKFAIAGALLGWFAIIMQWYLSNSIRILSLPEFFLRFIGYFTITTNILAALTFTMYAFSSSSRLGRWLRQPDSIFAITVFIIIVGIVYNTILRFLWQPTGLQWLVDELLHTIQPLLFFLFWYLFIPKQVLTVKRFLSWLIYPAVYMLYIGILGVFTGHYPYPFADVGQLGYYRALLNGASVVLASIVIAWLLIILTRRVGFLSKERR